MSHHIASFCKSQLLASLARLVYVTTSAPPESSEDGGGVGSAACAEITTCRVGSVVGTVGGMSSTNGRILKLIRTGVQLPTLLLPRDQARQVLQLVSSDVNVFIISQTPNIVVHASPL